MFKFLNNYLVSLCAVSLMTTVLYKLAPKGKSANILKIILSLFVVFAVIVPFLKVNINTKDMNIFDLQKVDIKTDIWSESADVIESAIKDIVLNCVEDEARVVCQKIELEISAENNVFKADKAIIYIPFPKNGNILTLKNKLYELTSIEWKVIIV